MSLYLIMLSLFLIIRKYTEAIRNCILKAGSENFALILKVLPLYHWFSEESPKHPFFSLNYDVHSLSHMIEGKDKRILPLSVKNRYIHNSGL